MTDGLTFPRRRRLAGYGVATAGMGVLVAALLPLRGDVDELSMGWAFLTLVVTAAAIGGLGPGVVASFVAFAAYNYFFFPPYETFAIAHREHLIILFVFLGLSVLISFMLARATDRARVAEARTAELRLQQDLATALVEPRPGTETYGTVLRLMAARLGLDGADLYLTSPGAGLELSTSTGPAVASPGARDGAERFPLVVGRQSVGLLVVHRADPLDAAERRIVGAFGDQLALVLERDRLLRESVERQRSSLGSS